MKIENNLYYDVISNPELLKNKKEISKAFSEIFLNEVFKEIQKEFTSNSLFGNTFGSNIYFDLYFKELSMMIAQDDNFPLNKFFEENLKITK